MNPIVDEARKIIVPFSAQMLDIVLQALMQRAYAEVAHVVQHISGHVEIHNQQVLADLKRTDPEPQTGQVIGYAGQAPGALPPITGSGSTGETGGAL